MSFRFHGKMISNLTASRKPSPPAETTDPRKRYETGYQLSLLINLQITFSVNWVIIWSVKSDNRVWKQWKSSSPRLQVDRQIRCSHSGGCFCKITTGADISCSDDITNGFTRGCSPKQFVFVPCWQSAITQQNDTHNCCFVLFPMGITEYYCSILSAFLNSVRALDTQPEAQKWSFIDGSQCKFLFV